MHKTLSILALLFTFYAVSSAQENICFSSRLKTLQVKINGEWGEPPVMLLNGSNWIEISFDDLQAQYQRYTYSITHCNADWKQSDLLVSEYMTGFNDCRLDNYEPAIGTEMDYCHYTLRLPNEENKLLVSGNYRIDIFEDGEDEPIAQACFSIIEPHVGVEMSSSGNTDLDTYDSHQQVSFSVNYSGYQVSDPINEFKYIVQQNRRWDNHADGIMPSSMRINKLIFDHNRSLIFPAGNEYRRFEILDEYVATMGVDRMEFDGDYYHAFIFPDEQRINYLYDQDQDGRYIIHNDDNVANDTQSDYFFTHFTLQMPQIPGGDVYLFGDLTGNRIDEEYKMEYNLIDHQYELTTPLKQGTYNYMLMFVRDGESIALTRQTEGDFHQTENEYYIYVYHRGVGERYDKLVGFQKMKHKE